MIKRNWFVPVGGILFCLAGAQTVNAACTGDPVLGFTCTPQGNVAVGAVFASDSGARRNISLALVEDLLEEEAEQTGGGAGDGRPIDVYAAVAYADKEFDTERLLGQDSDSLGVQVGATMRGSNYFVGAALDYSNEDADIKQDAGEIDTDEFGIQLYGTYYPMARKNLFLTASLRYAWADIDTKRTFLTDPAAPTNPGVLNTAKGSTDRDTYGVLAGAGYSWPIQSQTVASLSGWLSWQHYETDAYTESGAIAQGAANATGNLRFEEDSYSTLDGIVTLDVVHEVPITNGRLLPAASVSFVHEFDTDTRNIDARIADISPPDPTNSIIRFRTNEADRNYFRLGASLTAQYDRGTTLYASYAGIVGHDWRSENLFSIGIVQAF